MKYLTVRELAAYWNVTEAHIRRLIRKGTLVPTKLGRLVRFTEENIAAFVRTHPTYRGPNDTEF